MHYLCLKYNYFSYRDVHLITYCYCYNYYELISYKTLVVPCLSHVDPVFCETDEGQSLV